MRESMEQCARKAADAAERRLSASPAIQSARDAVNAVETLKRANGGVGTVARERQLERALKEEVAAREKLEVCTLLWIDITTFVHWYESIDCCWLSETVVAVLATRVSR